MNFYNNSKKRLTQPGSSSVEQVQNTGTNMPCQHGEIIVKPKRTQLNMHFLWVVLACNFFWGGLHSFAQTKPLTLQEQMEVFCDENPLFLVDIGNANLAVRYRKGEGTPLVFVHGSWGDHHSWMPIVVQLAKTIDNPIILYDRRGHSASTPDSTQGSIDQDVNDVVLLTQALGFEKAHFIGHSYGSNMVVQLVSNYPEMAESVVLYEPPLFGILKGKPAYTDILKETKKEMLQSKTLLEDGEIEKGTIQFIEKVAFGDSSWKHVFGESERATMVANYDTWLDQYYDTLRLNVKPEKLNDFSGNITILYGSATLPVYRAVVTELDEIVEDKRIASIENAGHGGPISHPGETALLILQHLQGLKANHIISMSEEE